MNIHEYQAKYLFQSAGIPVPKGEVLSTPDAVMDVVEKLKEEAWVVKAQVHAGGRGKAGGVRIVKSEEALKAAVKDLLGSQLVTAQTDEQGQPIHQLLIEAPSNIERELYVAMTIDRAAQRIVVMASTQGGVDIEVVSDTSPDQILTIVVDPMLGLQPFQCRELCFSLGLGSSHMRSFVDILTKLYHLFTTHDCSLLEINPLVVTTAGELVCLDAKLNMDDSALYRQPELRNMRDTTQEDAQEELARQWDLSYIKLEGNIGCMVNGAGLAMATMDLIKLHGGHPANFLDVGGSATQERVTEAFKIIISDPNVQGIFVNIFGGIVRCDLIADGIISAIQDVGVRVPVVVRLEGNRAELGMNKLSDSGVNVIPASSFSDAAKEIVSRVSH